MADSANTDPQNVVAADRIQISLGETRPNKCAFCACKENLRVHRAVPDRWGQYVFCKDTDCSKKYDTFVYSNHLNLTNGIPYCYTSDAEEEYGFKRKSRPIKIQKKTRKVKKSTLRKHLTCAYCGVSNENVIRNSSIKSRYVHLDFCKNGTCCPSYTKYVDSVSRIPHALCVVPTVSSDSDSDEDTDSTDSSQNDDSSQSEDIETD